MKAQSHAHSHFPLEYLKDKDQDIHETKSPSANFVLDLGEGILDYFQKKIQYQNGCSGTLQN